MENILTFFKKFWYNHPIISNVTLMIISLFLLGWITLWFLDIWTHHGDTTQVPNVIGMNYNRAVTTLQDADLDVVISDSVYTREKGKIPGSVIDVIPQPGAVVKAGREVYVTIVAFSPEPVTIDTDLTEMTEKNALAYLKSRNLKVETKPVPSQYSGIVIDAKCKGRSLMLGSKVTVDDVIILEVGRIPEPVYDEPDSVDALNAAIEANIQATENENDPF